MSKFAERIVGCLVVAETAEAAFNMQIEAQIRTYIAENLLFSENGYEYDNDASFLQKGIIDSMGVMELVSFVVAMFGIQVQPHEVVPENFDSVNKLADFIRRKNAAGEQKVEAVL